MAEFYAVVMAGGSGTRFWPMSRASRPKQLLPLLGGRPLVRETIERLSPLLPPERVFIITGKEQADAVAPSNTESGVAWAIREFALDGA